MNTDEDDIRLSRFARPTLTPVPIVAAGVIQSAVRWLETRMIIRRL